MSLADARVEIIASYAGFKSSLRRGLAEAAAAASGSFDKQMQGEASKTASKLEQVFSDAGKKIEGSLGGAANRAKSSLAGLGNLDVSKLGAGADKAAATITGKLGAAADRVKTKLGSLFSDVATDAGKAGDSAGAGLSDGIGSRLSGLTARISSSLGSAGEAAGARFSSLFTRLIESDIGTKAASSGSGAGREFGDGFGAAARAGIAASLARIAATAAIIAPLLGPIVSVLSAAAAAAVALGAALGAAATGGAAALAGAVGAAVSVLGTITVASLGVVKALKAQSKAQDEAGTAATSAAASQRTAARAVASAQDQVTSSTESAARAQQTLTDAQKDQKAAATDLARSYQTARQALEDLHQETAGAATDQRQAALDLKKAKEALAAATAPGSTATADDREQAQIDADKAQENYTQAVTRTQRLQKQQADADRKGVAGSDAVTAAKDNLAKANERVAEAQTGAADAARSLARAQTALADATTDAAAAASKQSTAAAAYTAALAGLDVNARAVVTSLTALGARFSGLQKTVQHRLFAGVAAEIDALGRVYAPRAITALTGIASTTNRVSLGLARMLASAKSASAIDAIVANNQHALDAFSGAIAPATEVVLTLARAFSPLAARIGYAATGLAYFTRNSLRAAQQSGALTRFVDASWHAAATLARTLGNLTRALGTVFAAGIGTGQSFLDVLERLSARFLAFTRSVAGRNAIAGWFAEGKQTARELAGLVSDIATAFGHLGKGTDASDFVAKIRGLIPPIEQLLGAISGGTGDVPNKIVTAIQSILDSLNRANAGGAIASFVDTIAELVSVMASIVQSVPGGTDTLGKLAVALGAFAAVKFAANVSGLAKLPGIVSGIAGAGANLGRGFAGLETATGTAGKLGGALGRLRDGFRDAGAAQSAFSGVAGTLGGKLRAVVDGIAGLGGNITTAARSVGTMTAAVTANTIAWARNAAAVALAAVRTAALAVAQGVVRAATVAWTAAQTLLDIALDANPIGLAVIAIAALVGVVILIARHSEAFRRVLVKVGEALKTAAIFWFKYLTPLGLVLTHTKQIREGFDRLRDAVVGFFRNGLDRAEQYVTGWIKRIRDVFSPDHLLDNLIDLDRRVLRLFRLDGVVTYVSGLINRLRKFFTPGQILQNLAGLDRAVLRYFHLDGIANAVAQWISGLHQRFSDAGSRLIQAFLDGLSRVGDFAANLGRSVLNHLRSPLQTIVSEINGALKHIPFVHIQLPNIPKFAAGGILDRSTLLVAGEAGREVIVPLTRPDRAEMLARESGLLDLLVRRGVVAHVDPDTLRPAPGPAAAAAARITGGAPPAAAGARVERHTATTGGARSVTIGALNIHTPATDAAAVAHAAAARVARLLNI